MYRGALGWPDRRDPPFDSVQLRERAVVGGESIVIADTRRDERILAPTPDAVSMLVLPLRFGNEIIGTFELDHHKPHVYGKKEVAAAATFASQLATAIHISDLRRPLSDTVERVGVQVKALVATADSLRSSAGAVAQTAQAIRAGAAEQEQLVAQGREATASLVSQARRSRPTGRRWREPPGSPVRPPPAIASRSRTRSAGWCSCSSSWMPPPARSATSTR